MCIRDSPVVPRYNGQRSQRVQCSPVPGVETEKARQSIAGQIERIPLPAGYKLQWQGERNASTKSMQYLFKKYPIEAQFTGPDPAVLHPLADSAQMCIRDRLYTLRGGS